MKGKIISVCNTKGGSGKTTTALSIAGELRRRGYKVLVIDNDPQATATKFYHAAWKDMATMADVYFNEEAIKATELIQHTSRGDIVPSDPCLKQSIRTAINIKHYKRPYVILHDYAKANYDFTIIDTQGAPGTAVSSSLMMSDYVILPTVPTKSNIFEIADTIKDIKEIKEMDNKSLEMLGILICNGKEKGLVTNAAKEFLMLKAKENKTFVYDTIIRLSSDVPGSENLDMDINDYCENDSLRDKACKVKKKNAIPEETELDRITLVKSTNSNIKLVDTIDGVSVKWEIKGDSHGVKIINSILDITDATDKSIIELSVSMAAKTLSRTIDIKINKANAGYDYKAVVDEMLKKIY